MELLTDRWNRPLETNSRKTDPTTVPEDALLFEPRETYDKGLLGSIVAGGKRVALYSRAKIIDALIIDNDWGDAEAEEWVDFNTTGAYVGPLTPVVED